MGLAAENIGVTTARREVTILPAWDDARACHPLAVHFCSADHKNRYMAALFETEDVPAETRITTKAVTPRSSVEREYVRTTNARPIASAKKKTRKARRTA